MKNKPQGPVTGGYGTCEQEGTPPAVSTPGVQAESVQLGGWDGGSSRTKRTSFVVKFNDTASFIHSLIQQIVYHYLFGAWL